MSQQLFVPSLTLYITSVFQDLHNYFFIYFVSTVQICLGFCTLVINLMLEQVFVNKSIGFILLNIQLFIVSFRIIVSAIFFVFVISTFLYHIYMEIEHIVLMHIRPHQFEFLDIFELEQTRYNIVFKIIQCFVLLLCILLFVHYNL